MMRRVAAGLFGGAGATCGGYTYFNRGGMMAYATAAESSPFAPVDILPSGEGEKTFDYDLVVIGGGSGGLAAAKRAADHGAKVALCDFVRPSTQGTTWGLGGTCVNVGCIPKKLMHTAALQGEMMEKSVRHFGWHVEGESLDPATLSSYKAPKMVCDWSILQGNIEAHIRSLNFGYNSQLMDKNIKYIRGSAKFKDAHTLECTNKQGKVSEVTARRVVIATGGRPYVPDNVPGAVEHAITSDDVFRLKRDPGKTCVIGAGYVALETAGFLHGIGREASVMVRSRVLRGFDQDMGDQIANYMKSSGIKFHEHTVPVKVEKRADDGKLEVTMENWETGEKTSEIFDTVMFATGRAPETKNLGLENVGVETTKSGHVVIDKHDRTTAPHVYAIGDIVQGGLELTPVAIKAGQLLADRLYNKGTQLMDFKTVPTTVFTPLEYGCVGLSEENAKERLGDSNTEVYHTYLTPLEWTVPKEDMPQDSTYIKLVVEKATEKVLGFHVLAPNAGEITQGMAVAIKKGITRADLADTIGIHPTIAEDVTNLTITKSSGEDPKKGNC